MSKFYLLPLLFCYFSALGQQLPDRASRAGKSFQSREYGLAAKLYSSLIVSKERVDYVSRLAECYRQMKNYALAEKWFEREMELQPTNGLDRLYYSDVLHQNNKTSEAEQNLALFVPKTIQEKEIKEQRLASYASLKSLLKPNEEYVVVNSRSLNSQYSDFASAIYDNKLVFVSNRPLSKEVLRSNPQYKRIYGWTNTPFWKLFETSFGALGNTVTPSLMPAVINSPYNNGPAVFSKQGDVLWFSKSEEGYSKGNFFTISPTKFSNHTGIYISRKGNQTWSLPEAFPINNLKSYSVSHPALSPDGKLLYFASDMPGGKGGVDLYYVEIGEGGKSYGTPVNLGDSINTPMDEEFPTFGPDSTLYFSSNGWKGLGALDIFKSNGSKISWNRPVNLGAPVNSKRDDFFILFRSGKPYRGYFSSNRAGGLGDDDIYAFEYNQRLPDTIRPVPNVQKLQIAKDSIKAFFKLGGSEIVSKQILQIPNIYYLTGKADPLPIGFPVLDRLVRLLQLYPTMHVQVRSHTDAVGKAASNLKLSQARANWVKGYLEQHSIAPERLIAKGFGKTLMLVKCGVKKPCSARQNKQNRRTEIKVLKI